MSIKMALCWGVLWLLGTNLNTGNFPEGVVVGGVGAEDPEGPLPLPDVALEDPLTYPLDPGKVEGVVEIGILDLPPGVV